MGISYCARCRSPWVGGVWDWCLVVGRGVDGVPVLTSMKSSAVRPSYEVVERGLCDECTGETLRARDTAVAVSL